MTQLPYMTPDFRGFDDRRTMLLVMGILLIVLGAAGGCLTLAAPLTMFLPGVPANQRLPLRDVVGGSVVLLAITVALVWTGIGSIMKRRWVRPIVLSSASIALVIGVLTAITSVFTFSDIQATMATSPLGAQTTTAFKAGMIAVMLATTLIPYVIIPAILILCYRPLAVQATLEFYDPTPRWTDDCPIPVLTLVMLLILTTFSMLTMSVKGVAMFFGLALSGAAGRATLILAAALFALATRWCFQLRLKGWILAMTLFVLLPLSATLTLLRIPLLEIYRAGGMTDQQLDMIAKMRIVRSGWIILWLLLSGFLAAGYALLVRRYFVRYSEAAIAE